MNRTDRLLAIVLELQARRKQRAEDLASTFEVSKRTIYRDVEALCEMGVPVVSVPGQGYSLVAGYFLPPLRFTTDEAIMLVLGSDFMADNFDAEYRLAAQSAGRKIVAALPDELKAEVKSLEETIRFIVIDTPVQVERNLWLQPIRRAILSRRTLSFEYHRRHISEDATDVQMERQADPYGLVNFDGAWYISAYCHLRHGIRHFRLDRMTNLRVLDATFKRPDNYSIVQKDDTSRRVRVRALFSPDVQSWVQESPSFYTVSQEETPEGLLVTLMARHERDVLQWLLGWGKSVRVLEPQSLIDMLAEEAEAILSKYGKAKTLLT
ncbi:MAG: YafY family protein [Chloroflexia bacterium]